MASDQREEDGIREKIIGWHQREENRLAPERREEAGTGEKIIGWHQREEN